MTKKFAAVDIGSNTIKVTITDYWESGKFEKILYKDFPSCLGHNMSDKNNIDENELSGCYSALNEIKRILRENKVDEFRYIATHALREAANQKQILSLLKSNTGVEIEVISGEEEARLTLDAILIDLPPTSNYACINAGGGSTELSFYLADSVNKQLLIFFRFGAVNLFENYIKLDSNIEHAIKNIEKLISTEFKTQISHLPKIDKVISVGGSIYNAAYIHKKDKERKFDDLFMLKLSASDLKSVINQLKLSKEIDKQKIIGLDEKRIHTILPGILIHYFLLNLLGKTDLVISTRTISDGLIYRMARNK